MKTIQQIFIVISYFLLSTLANSTVPPFQLHVDSSNKDINATAVSLREGAHSHNGVKFALVDKASPPIIGQVVNGTLSSLTYNTKTKKYVPSGEIGGLLRAKKLGNVRREHLIVRKPAGAGAGFKKSSSGFYLDAVPGKRAYYLYHKTKPGVTNGFMACKSTQANFYSIFYTEEPTQTKLSNGCQYVGLYAYVV